MSNYYDAFEKRFTNAWFSVGWVEVEAKPASPIVSRKDLSVLQEELEKIQDEIDNNSQAQLRLANLAKFYRV